MMELSGTAFVVIVFKAFFSHKNTLFLPYLTNFFGLERSLQSAQVD